MFFIFLYFDFVIIFIINFFRSFFVCFFSLFLFHSFGLFFFCLFSNTTKTKNTFISCTNNVFFAKLTPNHVKNTQMLICASLRARVNHIFCRFSAPRNECFVQCSKNSVFFLNFHSLTFLCYLYQFSILRIQKTISCTYKHLHWTKYILQIAHTLTHTWRLSKSKHPINVTKLPT